MYMECRDGAVVRMLTSHQCTPHSILAQCHMWVEFVVGSHLAPRYFSGFSSFPSSTKKKQLLLGHFQFHQDTAPAWKSAKADVACSLNIVIFYIYYMASSASRQDDLNRVMWLATWAGKMEPSCPLRTTRCILQEKLPQKPYNKSFIDEVCLLKMAGYWPRSFFASLLTSTSSWSINTQKKNLANMQPSWPHTWSITHTYKVCACSNSYSELLRCQTSQVTNYKEAVWPGGYTGGWWSKSSSDHDKNETYPRSTPWSCL